MMRNTRRTALTTAGLVLAIGLAGGPALWSAAAGAEESLWGAKSPAGVSTASEDQDSVELGTAFTVEVDGEITGIRYWRSSTSSTGTPTGTLWGGRGDRLATASFASSSATGWQTVAFASPVKVEANDSFVASYHAPRGQYAVTEDYSGASVSANLSIPRVNAGRFAYSSSVSFPNRTWESSNYWVTPVFRASTGTPVPAPTAPAPTAPAPTASPSPNTPPPTSTGSGPIPGPNTTGVPSGTTLRASDQLRVTKANTILSGLDISGPVSIEAPGVVIEKSRIHGSGGGNGVQVRSGSVTIRDSEIYGFENGIGGDRWEAHRVDIHSTTGDGLKLGSDSLIANSWIHGLTPGSGAHADGIQVQSGVVNAVVRNNVIDLSDTRSPNAAISLLPT